MGKFVVYFNKNKLLVHMYIVKNTTVFLIVRCTVVIVNVL
jgi:hypothetical protein